MASGWGALLLILMAHLGFMTSPFHSEMVGGGDSVEVAAVVQAARSPGVSALAEDHGHCSLKWTRTSNGAEGLTLLGARYKPDPTWLIVDGEVLTPSHRDEEVCEDCRRRVT
jgi:hypothetical protein